MILNAMDAKWILAVAFEGDDGIMRDMADAMG